VRSDRDTRSGDEDEETFARELQARLRQAEDVDAVTRARLSAARARALDAAKRPRVAWAPWTALGGLVAAGLVAAAVLLRPESNPLMQGDLPRDIAPGEFFELVLDDDDPTADADMYEDLDVLVWLDGGDAHA
jgi:hypothetical protein